MKKVLIGLVVFVVLVVGVVAGLLFTRAGNEFLRPLIESNLQKKLPVSVALERFGLMPVDIVLKIADGSIVKIEGELSPLSQRFDLRYDIRIKDLAPLKPLTGADLQGPLNTEGVIRGALDRFDVVGRSDVAQSKTAYDVIIENLEPKRVVATIDHARIEKLLYMVKQPEFIKGRLDLDANLTDLDPDHLAGDLVALIDRAHIDRDLMKKSFGVDLPKTTIKSHTKAKLEATKIRLDSKTDSNLLKLMVAGEIETQKMATDLAYDLKVAKLELLKPITKTDLRGEFNTHGTIKGNRSKTIVDGKSDVAGSHTSYRVVLKEYSPASLEASVRGAKLAKILYMINQPHYADATIDSKISLTSLDPKRLSGQIVSKVRGGKTDAATLKRVFDLDGAKIAFKADQTTTIEKGVATSDIAIDSSVAKVSTEGARFDLNSGKLDASYVAVVPDLNRLYFLTKQHMKGNLKLTGQIKKDKDLLVTAHSDTLGGTFDAKILNDDLEATLKKIKFTALTEMLLYPKIFDSTLDADLTYNLLSKKGKLLAKAFNGRILPNQMTFLLQQMANFDITKEIYKETTLTSEIDDKKIVSNLDMQSRLTHITSERALLDLEKKVVDAKLRIEIQKRPLYVKIKGPLSSPKVSLDAKSLVKARAKKEVEKRLQKELKGKVPDAAKGLLKGFFQ